MGPAHRAHRHPRGQRAGGDRRGAGAGAGRDDCRRVGTGGARFALAAMKVTIELEQVQAARGGQQVLRDVTLSVAAGEVVAVAGASGSGKTTLLRLVLGLETPSAGWVKIDGITVSAPHTILVPPERRGLAIVFQDLALWPHLTVSGNLEFALRVAGLAATERRDRTEAMLE